VNDPAVVWADEPTGNLDSESAAEILDLIERLNRENGQTFVLVTHDPRVAERAGRILRMRDGRIESEERPSRTAGSGPISRASAPREARPPEAPRR
jgi:putative ABC transport system ATP-binding protein